MFVFQQNGLVAALALSTLFAVTHGRSIPNSEQVEGMKFSEVTKRDNENPIYNDYPVPSNTSDPSLTLVFVTESGFSADITPTQAEPLLTKASNRLGVEDPSKRLFGFGQLQIGYGDFTFIIRGSADTDAGAVYGQSALSYGDAKRAVDGWGKWFANTTLHGKDSVTPVPYVNIESPTKRLGYMWIAQ